MKKTLIVILSILIIGLLIFGYIWFYVPFSDEGTKIGQLNDFRHKGIIFKTYEGRLIQTGIKAGNAGGVQSNMFEFSVANQRVADKLKAINTQQVIKLHYKEYFGALPWRGYTKYIVDSIEVSNTPQQFSPEVGGAEYMIGQ